MKDEENVITYLLHVDEIVNTIRGLSENIEYPMIVQNVLRSLHLIFDIKVSTNEEMEYIHKLTMD